MKKKQRPERDSLFEFYLQPIMNGVARISEALAKGIRGLAGWWFCEYCEKYHGPRTRAFWTRGKSGALNCHCSLPRPEEKE